MIFHRSHLTIHDGNSHRVEDQFLKGDKTVIKRLKSAWLLDTFGRASQIYCMLSRGFSPNGQPRNH
jgi:hypothetical protein